MEACLITGVVIFVFLSFHSLYLSSSYYSPLANEQADEGDPSLPGEAKGHGELCTQFGRGMDEVGKSSFVQ